jgi:hypothetical protein
MFGLWQTRYVVLAGCLLLVAIGCLAAVISRRALLGYLTISASSAGGIALLEFVGMIGIVSWSALLSPQSSPLGTEPMPHIEVNGTTWQDTASVWGLASEPITFQYRTDQHGFRNNIDRSEADIYLIGDSVLVAALVPFSQTVTSRLEAAVNKRVMQIALIGLSPQEEQQIFRNANLDVKGRLVIQFIFEGNDLPDSRRLYKSRSIMAGAPRTERTLSHYIIIALQKLTQPVSGMATLRTCTINSQQYTFMWGRESFYGLDNELTKISTALASFAAEIRKAGGEFGVVFVPSKLRVLGPQCSFPPGSEIANFTEHIGPMRRYMHDWSKRNKVPLLDLTEPLREAASSGHIPWYWGDTHWNADGHAVASSMLSSWEPAKAVRSSKFD